MIILLVGENNFLKQQQIASMKTKFNDQLARYDGEALDSSSWQELSMNQSLFGTKQLILVDDLSKNNTLWDNLATDRTFNDNTIILNEMKLDKRTKTWKWLQKQAKIIDCQPMSDRDERQAVGWLKEYAAANQIKLNDDLAREMVKRAIRRSDTDDRQTIIDQELLATTIKQLTGSTDISSEALDAVLAPSSHDNIFELFATALGGDSERVHQSIGRLSAEQDGYLAMGLLATQAQQLAGLVLGQGRSIDDIAGDLGVHPYPLRQLSRYASRLSEAKVASIVSALAEADINIKSGKAEPWLAIENALQSITTI